VLPMTIDFESHIPYYHQLLEIIKLKIKDGTWAPGDRIPSEAELCDTYGVSRTVVRQALRELESESIITRRKGKGTFVAKPKISEGLIQKLTGFYQDMTERGLEPGTKVLFQQIVPANQKIARYLDVPMGTDIVDIKRLRFIHEEPIQLVTTYIPRHLSPDLVDIDLSNRSLYAYLETENGIKIARGIRYIEAVLANKEEAELLEIDEGDPLIMLDSVSYTETGQAIEYYHAIHRGDRSRFEVELIRLDEDDQQTP
jgi:GntR family transcriptional regulator